MEAMREEQEIHLGGQKADEEYEVSILQRILSADAVALVRLAEAFHDLLHHQQNGKQKYRGQLDIPDDQTELILPID